MNCSIRKLKPTSLFLAVFAIPFRQALALESMSDDMLSDISGQSGFTFTVASQTVLPASSLQWNIDAGDSVRGATLELVGPQVNGIGNNGVGIGAGGSSISGPFQDTTTLDVGSNGSVVGIGIASNWARQRLYVPSVDLRNASGVATIGNFGALAFDSSGSLAFANEGGLLNSSPAYSADNSLRLTLGSPQLGVAYAGQAAQLYYRQGGVGQPELVADNLYLDTGFTSGIGGVIGTCLSSLPCGQFAGGTFAAGSSGVLISTPHLDFNVSFKLRDRLNPAVAAGGGAITPAAFTTAGGDAVSDLFTYGYGGGAAMNGVAAPSGGFNNAELLVAGGGMWTAPTGTQTYNPDLPANRSQGVNLAFHGNYDSNFNWVFGPGGGAELVQFGGWTQIPGSNYGLNAPNITIDVINAGQEPGGLCWGASVYGGSGACSAGVFTRFNGQAVTGQLLNIAMPSNSTAFALAVRDMSLQAYSTKSTILQDLNGDGQFSGSSVVNGNPVSEVQNVNWALGYTLGTVDGNVYLYPTNGSGGNGLTADVLFMSQSFGKSSGNTLLNNTNLFIGDTDSHFGGASGQNLGIGLLQSNFLLAARQMNIGLTSSGIEFKTLASRADVNGMFAGGTIPSMTDCSSTTPAGTSCQINMFQLDANFEFTNLDFTVTPKTRNGVSYLSFDGAFTLGALPTPASGGFGSGNGSYISIGEPSSGAEKGANITFGNITGAGNIINSGVAFIPASDVIDTATATGSADGHTRLQLAAGLSLSQPLQVGSVSLQGGGATLGPQLNLGTVVFSAGSQLYSSVELKRQ